ncbi:hypothetical protein Ancab_014911 [Ancistrocladus abbreviatus]
MGDGDGSEGRKMQVKEANFFKWSIHFSLKVDYDHARLRGLWIINDYYLAIIKWSLSFDPESALMDRLALWMQIAMFLLSYYDDEILTRLQNMVGTIHLKIDRNTVLIVGILLVFVSRLISQNLFCPNSYFIVKLSKTNIRGFTWYTSIMDTMVKDWSCAPVTYLGQYSSTRAEGGAHMFLSSHLLEQSMDIPGRPSCPLRSYYFYRVYGMEHLCCTRYDVSAYFTAMVQQTHDWLGKCSVLIAKLWGAYVRLSHVWLMGCHQVEVELDSKLVIDLLL